MTDAEASALTARLRAAQAIIAAVEKMRAGQRLPSVRRTFYGRDEEKTVTAYEDHVDRLLALWAEAEAEGNP